MVYVVKGNGDTMDNNEYAILYSDVKEKYAKQYDAVKEHDAFDENTKQLMVDALTLKEKSDLRAVDAMIKRERERDFMAHFVKGCPECSHQYRPAANEIVKAVQLRLASNTKI